MGVLFGGLASLFYGVGDFLGGEGAKRGTAPTVVLWAGVVSFPVIALVAPLAGGNATRSDLALGAAAGALGAIGLVWLFAGLGRGQAAAVAPTAALSSAIVPVTVALAGGETLSVVEWAGVALALPAILLCSWVADPGEVPLGGVRYGLAAGAGFGGYTAIIDLTSAGSGLLPLIPARAATMAVVLALASVGLWKVDGWGRAPRAIAAGNGLLDVAGNVAVLLGLRLGSLARVSIAAAFYPAVTVILARLVNSEHLRARQILGLGLSVLALSAIAFG